VKLGGFETFVTVRNVIVSWNGPSLAEKKKLSINHSIFPILFLQLIRIIKDPTLRNFAT